MLLIRVQICVHVLVVMARSVTTGCVLCHVRLRTRRYGKCVVDEQEGDDWLCAVVRLTVNKKVTTSRAPCREVDGEHEGDESHTPQYGRYPNDCASSRSAGAPWCRPRCPQLRATAAAAASPSYSVMHWSKCSYTISHVRTAAQVTS